jgi:integrase
VDFHAFLKQLELFCNTISKNKLEEIREITTRAHERRFRRRKEPRYGSINKGFTEQELQVFLRVLRSEKFKLLFKYQAFLGLRVGEACKLHISNIDFSKRELTIKSEKSQKTDALIIPMDLFKETIEYIAKNEANIKASNGYIFFKENDRSNTGNLHLAVDYVRNVFRETIKEAGLDQAYALSEETVASRRSRALHRLTTHSLRHYAITHFAKSTNGNVVLASRFARHSDPSTTMRYIAKDNDELYKNIDFAFSDKLASLKRLAKL